MSTFTRVDLGKLPPPAMIETLAYETILADWKAALLEQFPAVDLESDPVIAVVEVAAFRELLLRARYNDGLRGVLLATATGSDLDNLAAFYGTQRLVLDPGDPDASPPVPPTMESDEAFRNRVQLAIEAQSVAGPTGAYIYHALTSDARVHDAGVYSSTPGQVDVVILTADGNPSTNLLTVVLDYLSADERRPLTDTVVVAYATMIDYTIEAELTVYPGPDSAIVLAAAQAAVESYVSGSFRIGYDVTRSGIFAALHQPGVQNVNLIAPAADIVVGQTEAARNTALTISVVGTDV